MAELYVDCLAVGIRQRRSRLYRTNIASIKRNANVIDGDVMSCSLLYPHYSGLASVTGHGENRPPLRHHLE